MKYTIVRKQIISIEEMEIEDVDLYAQYLQGTLGEHEYCEIHGKDSYTKVVPSMGNGRIIESESLDFGKPGIDRFALLEDEHFEEINQEPIQD